MNADPPPDAGRLALYLTPEHACSYLPPRPAQTLFVDPLARPNPQVYEHLLGLGFRRSGDHVYRPHCPGCRACVPVRLPVAEFAPRRSQRRCWLRGQEGLEVHQRPPLFDPAHYLLYQRYTAARHADGGMADADERRYMEFLTTHWCPTRFVELLRDGRLLAVAVTDELPHTLSAVYTFFDPQRSDLSPGVLAILWQVREATRRGLEYLYLGYWIGASDKMSYKDQYRPLEAWDGHGWRRFGAGRPIAID
jgi:arginyl-tRNA--protein-N-Asp/Glu arginylyltransferase